MIVDIWKILTEEVGPYKELCELCSTDDFILNISHTISEPRVPVASLYAENSPNNTLIASSSGDTIEDAIENLARKSVVLLNDRKNSNLVFVAHGNPVYVEKELDHMSIYETMTFFFYMNGARKNLDHKIKYRVDSPGFIGESDKELIVKQVKDLLNGR